MTYPSFKLEKIVGVIVSGFDGILQTDGAEHSLTSDQCQSKVAAKGSAKTKKVSDKCSETFDWFVVSRQGIEPRTY